MLDLLLTPAAFTILIIAVAISLLLGLRLAKDPGFGLVLMAFFLPFERIPSIDIGGFTFKINHFIGLLTFVFWLLAVVYNRRKIVPNPLTIPLLLLFFVFLLSGLNAGDSFRQLTVYISIGLMVVLYTVTINSLTNKNTLQTLVGVLLLAAGLMGIVGIYQFFGDLAGLPTTLTGLDPGYTKYVFGFPRIHAFSKEPLYYANYLFIPLGISLALFFSKQTKVATHNLFDRLRGPWLLPIIILLFVNFFLTLSRGAFIGLVPFLLIFAAFYYRRIFNIRNVLLAAVVMVITLTAVYQILDSVSFDAVDRFIGHATLNDVFVTKSGESGLGRLSDFQEALRAWRTSPVTGIGLGNFGPFVADYPLAKPVLGGWRIVNNEYLELLAETGVVGLGAFCVMLGVLFGRSVQAYRKVGDEYLRALLIGLNAALVGILVQYNFFSTLYIIHIWVAIGLVVGVQNLILTPKRLPVEAA